MSYECTFICSPDLDVTKVDEIISKATKIVETSKGTIKNLQQLGKKKLAYNINKFREGIYVYMELEGDGSMLQPLENFFKVNDGVIRFLTVKVEVKKNKKIKKTNEKKAEKIEVKPVEETKEEIKTETENNESTQLSDTPAE
jgi:small subunit ribosomal protein S6